MPPGAIALTVMPRGLSHRDQILASVRHRDLRGVDGWKVYVGNPFAAVDLAPVYTLANLSALNEDVTALLKILEGALHSGLAEAGDLGERLLADVGHSGLVAEMGSDGAGDLDGCRCEVDVEHHHVHPIHA